MKLKSIQLATLISASVMSIPLACAADSVEGVSPERQKQIENVVHNYLVKNPEVLVESMQVLQQKQMEQARKTVQQTQESSNKFADAIFHSSSDPVVGNAKGKVTVVEFFDYQCPHCIEMTPVLEALIAANSNVRVVFKEFPIRGPMSEMSTRAALAAKIQGKYFEMHKGLMQSKTEPLTEDAIYKIAQSVGLDLTKLKADMKSDEVSKQIKANYKLAQDLQLLGTPAFFIAKTDVSASSPASAIVFIPGQVDQTQLSAAIDKVSK